MTTITVKVLHVKQKAIKRKWASLLGYFLHPWERVSSWQFSQMERSWVMWGLCESESYDAADWGRVEFLRCLSVSVQPRCARTGYVMRLGDRVRAQATVLYARREQDMGAEWSAARTRSGTWTWWEHVKRNCMALVDIAPMSFLLLFLILISGFGNKPKKHKSKVGAKTHKQKKKSWINPFGTQLDL